MKKLLNTLYITSEDSYLALNGETVEVWAQDGSKKRIPLHTLESIVSFSYKGASPALMGKCVDNNIQLSFFTPRGRFLASCTNSTNGSVLLRQQQYRIADDNSRALDFAKCFVAGKLYNSKYVLLRCIRDHEYQIEVKKMRTSVDCLSEALQKIDDVIVDDELRGVEGKAAVEYFGSFDDMIFRDKSSFFFHGRNRRPPMDNVNALLSFAYVLLANDCGSALSGAGLDPYVGFYHTERPGRKSLALDMMEELRAPIADRFVLSLVNNRKLKKNDFNQQETGAVRLTDQGRRVFLTEWQKRKKEEITHPFLKKKIPWGLVPHLQAMLLARCIRGELDAYPPFFWK